MPPSRTALDRESGSPRSIVAAAEAAQQEQNPIWDPGAAGSRREGSLPAFVLHGWRGALLV